MKRKTIRQKNNIFIISLFASFLVAMIGASCNVDLLAVIGGLGIVFAVAYRVISYRCPYCGKYLDRNNGDFCPCCGKKLDE